MMSGPTHRRAVPVSPRQDNKGEPSVAAASEQPGTGDRKASRTTEAQASTGDDARTEDNAGSADNAKNGDDNGSDREPKSGSDEH